jgi:hypothetical protein
MEENNYAKVANIARIAGNAGRDTVGYADLPDYQQKTVDSGVHIARSKIRGGLTVEQADLAIAKAELLHSAVVATLAAFRDGTAPSAEFAAKENWANV